MWLPLVFSLLVTHSAANGFGPRQVKEDNTTTAAQCFTYMCINGTITGTDVQYILTSTGQQTPGWMAMGFGTSMVGSPMVIMWTNSDGSITLSQRQASEHAMPIVVDNPPRLASIEDSLSVTSGDNIRFAFNIASDGNTNPDIIWAFSDTNPGSSAKDATIVKHIDKGVTNLNFANASNTTNSTGTNSGSNSGSTSNSTGTQSSNSNDSKTLLPCHETLAISMLICGLAVLL